MFVIDSALFFYFIFSQASPIWKLSQTVHVTHLSYDFHSDTYRLTIVYSLPECIHVNADEWFGSVWNQHLKQNFSVVILQWTARKHWNYLLFWTPVWKLYLRILKGRQRNLLAMCIQLFINGLYVLNVHFIIKLFILKG